MNSFADGHSTGANPLGMATIELLPVCSSTANKVKLNSAVIEAVHKIPLVDESQNRQSHFKSMKQLGIPVFSDSECLIIDHTDIIPYTPILEKDDYYSLLHQESIGNINAEKIEIGPDSTHHLLRELLNKIDEEPKTDSRPKSSIPLAPPTPFHHLAPSIRPPSSAHKISTTLFKPGTVTKIQHTTNPENGIYLDAPLVNTCDDLTCLQHRAALNSRLSREAFVVQSLKEQIFDMQQIMTDLSEMLLSAADISIEQILGKSLPKTFFLPPEANRKQLDLATDKAVLDLTLAIKEVVEAEMKTVPAPVAVELKASQDRLDNVERERDRLRVEGRVLRERLKNLMKKMNEEEKIKETERKNSSSPSKRDSNRKNVTERPQSPVHEDVSEEVEEELDILKKEARLAREAMKELEDQRLVLEDALHGIETLIKQQVNQQTPAASPSRRRWQMEMSSSRDPSVMTARPVLGNLSTPLRRQIPPLGSVKVDRRALSPSFMSRLSSRNPLSPPNPLSATSSRGAKSRSATRNQTQQVTEHQLHSVPFDLRSSFHSTTSYESPAAQSTRREAKWTKEWMASIQDQNLLYQNLQRLPPPFSESTGTDLRKESSPTNSRKETSKIDETPFSSSVTTTSTSLSAIGSRHVSPHARRIQQVLRHAIMNEVRTKASKRLMSPFSQKSNGTKPLNSQNYRGQHHQSDDEDEEEQENPVLTYKQSLNDNHEHSFHGQLLKKKKESVNWNRFHQKLVSKTAQQKVHNSLIDDVNDNHDILSGVSDVGSSSLAVQSRMALRQYSSLSPTQLTQSAVNSSRQLPTLSGVYSSQQSDSWRTPALPRPPKPYTPSRRTEFRNLIIDITTASPGQLVSVDIVE